MKKTYLSFIAFIISAIISVGNASVIPYLPPLQNFGGTSVDLPAFLPISGDYTLEVQGTAGTQISVADGVYTYTPEATGVIRFSQKRGKVYVYEGSVYKTTLTPISKTQFPSIVDATAHSDVNNLLVNSSFETVGATVTTDKYKFGSPWTTNVTEAAFGIRIGISANAVNGTKVCVWRGSGNTNYFSQSLTATVKSNKKYKVIVRQADGGNATANFILGIGSTVNGVEYGSTTLLLGNGKNGTWSGEFTTPSSVTGQTYFTFKNTPTNTASSGNDPVVQMDYIALVEGVDIPGISGASSATFLAGSAYAPENVVVDFENGDYYDISSYIANPSFEDVQADKQQTIPGWTKTGAANSEYCTRNDAGPASFKTGNVYFQYWSSSKPDFSISQILTGLPNGKYRLTVAAGGDAGTTGTYVYAGDNQTEVTNTGEHSVDAVVVNGTLTIGFKSVSRTVNWAYADNFRLYYLGEVHDPTLSVSVANLFLSENLTAKTFTVIGTNLTDDIAITTSAGSGLTVSQATIAKNAEGLATGINLTATYNPAAVTDATVDGTVSVVSGGITKTIAVKSFKNPTPTNLLGLALGNGHTGAGSEPSTFGWSSTNTVGWSEAVSSGIYSYAYRDGLHADIPRILNHPVDNAIFSFPVALEAGKSYLFSCKNSNFNNPGTVEATFAIATANDGTGTTLATQTALSGKWDTTTADFKFGMDVVATTGGYYLLWQTANGSDRNFIWALNLQEAYKVSFESNGGSAVDAQYAISGGTIVAPTDPTKDENSFLGWYADAALTTAWDFGTAISANTTLYAKWDTSTGISIVNDKLISTEYFTLQGQRLDRPTHNGVYLIKKTYASSKTEIVKVVYKKD